MADRLLAHPELSFSSAVGSNLRKAAWRIFSKQEVDVSCGHYRQTAKRCACHQVVLVSQDTTDISYPTHHASQGLGDLGGGKGQGNPGLCLHTAMALTEQGLPLGLVGQKLWAPQATGRDKRHRHYRLEEKESYRWVEALAWTSQHLSRVEQVVVVSDRESDFYEYMIAPGRSNIDLLFERWHLVLKQGMIVEKLQFDTFTRLAHAIALLSIIAWQLLWLKQLAAHSPDLALQEVFEPVQVAVLEKHSGKNQLNLRQALVLIAALAGFTPTKKQPLPGEKTIWRGWAIFSTLCDGYQLAFQQSYETA